ncbi:Stress response protein YvgO [Hyella patelloides LEGE 07179]|uniref:Stress response protein YvgO n=1 Tax=Hyella patelloides LEGE 07179 TaxID=945734 RepID=A0A563VWL5_9CYAN|nr:stress protein [Hyella patelloides]VEP15848.1 Stress response protein YvgO [Hyella patelloides LEGE 07179]
MIYSTNKSTTKKTTLEKLILSISLVALLISTFTLFPLPAQAKRISGNVSVQGDLTQLYSQISQDILTIRNRSACVKAIQERAYSGVRQRRNVMVFNLSQNYGKNLKNATFKQFRCAGSIYGLWTFTSGRFINKGDGGYINWAFAGKFRRTGKDGKSVVFRPIRR